MSIVERAKRISLSPQSEWPVIAAEPASAASIFSGYVAPLAAIGPIALLIGLSIVGVGVPFVGTYRAPIGSALVQAVFSFIMILVGVGVMSAIAGFLAPSFGGRRDSVAALKLVAYAYTPAFIAGVLGLIPPLGFLEIFAALWTLYVFYRGAPALAMSTQEKAIPFTAACVACGIVLGFVFMTTAGAVGLTTSAFARHSAFAGARGTDAGTAAVAGVLGAAMGGGSANTDRAKNMVDDIASAGNDAQKAEQSGDGAAQAQAGLKAIGAIVHGGAAPVTPIAHDDLKALLPDTVANLPRSSAEGSSGSLAGISASSAHATYGQADGTTIELSVADMGNVSGLAAAANLATTLQAENDSDSGYEKNVDVDGRRVHEKWTNDGKHSELMEIVDNRYAVSVDGTGVDMDTAMSALRSIDMTKFRALGAAHS